ncbi:hypothetical protein JHK87_012449 [Glycine soja]|nr:hypothetical protein JHK87_012449 [Glycine soja]
MEMDYVQSGEILYIPGTMTPIEIYPVSALGGFQYILALKKAFPHISMVASQGITIGALAVVLSDAIFDKDAIAQHDLDKIQKLAHSAALEQINLVEVKYPLELFKDALPVQFDYAESNGVSSYAYSLMS